MRRIPRWSVATLVLGALALGSVGPWYYRAQRSFLRRHAGTELRGIAQGKVDQIVAWRAELQADAELILASPSFVQLAERFLARPTSGVASLLAERLRGIQESHGYDAVRLVDRRGRVSLAAGGPAGVLDPEGSVALEVALRDRKPVLTNPHVPPGDTAPHVSLVAPLCTTAASCAVPLGAVVLVVSVPRVLAPLVASWPVPRRSAEAFLVRREGDSVLWLTGRRFPAGAGLSPSAPLARRDLLAVKAVLGDTGAVEGVDYRGIQVLAAVRPVPGSSWFLVVKVDRAEALAVWHLRTALVLALLLGGVAAAAAIAIAIWQRALRESEERFRSIALGTPDHITVQDRDLRYTMVVNPPIGLTEQQMIGRTDHEILPGDDAVRLTRLKRQVLESGRPVQAEVPVMSGSGVREYLEGAHIPRLDADGQVDGVIGYFRNVTARKQAEAERDALLAQLQQAGKLESVGRLAGGIAHEYNNALQTILLNVEMALDEAPPGSALRGYLAEIRSTGQRSAALTAQLLGFARKQTVSPKRLCLNEAVPGMLTMLRRLIGEDIALTWVPGAGLWPVWMDPAQLDQILANLVVNARDAIHGVGHLTIETANVTLDSAYCAAHAYFVPGQYALLTVSDDGCGMDGDTLAHAFEPFFTTKERGEGTGLGLATVYGIVKQNDGFINAHSELAHGTAFKIYLPRCRTVALEEQAPRREEPVRGGTETVLLVEDEPAVLSAAKAVLARLGYAVLAADLPGEALRVAQAHDGQIHLVLTDVVMPEMSGRELVQRLHAVRAGFRTLYMSGYPADVIAHRGVLEKGVRFLSKPFDGEALARAVREVLDET